MLTWTTNKLKFCVVHGACKDPTDVRQQCSVCNIHFHYVRNSTGIRDTSWQDLSKKQKKVWKCGSCQDTPTSIQSMIEDALKKEFALFQKGFMKGMMTQMKELEKMFRLNNEYLNNMAIHLNAMKKRVVQVEESRNEMRAENEEHKKKVHGLQATVESLEQKDFKNKIEVGNRYTNDEQNGRHCPSKRIR